MSRRPCRLFYAAGALLAFLCPVLASQTLTGAGNAVTVQVNVLDKDGTPVRNLKRENFRLLEEGKQQSIAGFEEVSDSASAGTPRPKAVVILLDEAHLTGDQFDRARDAAEKYVRDHMTRNDYFAVATHGNALRVLQNFTTDTDKVVAGIRQAAPAAETAQVATSSNTSAATRTSRRPGQSPEDTRAPFSLSFQSATYSALTLMRALQDLSTWLAQLRNRKAVLLFSEEFSAPANLSTEFGKTVNSAREANVGIYTIDARGLNSQGGGGAARDGAGVIAPQVAGVARSSGVDWAQFDRQTVQDVLRPLALQTGATAIYNASDFNRRLDGVHRELSNYYLLRFLSGKGKQDGSFRKLEVKTDVRDVEVRNRPGYFPPEAIDVLSGSKQESSLMALISSPAAAKIDITVRAGYFRGHEGDAATVPIVARIAAAAIQVRKKGGQLAADLHILGIAASENGSIVGRFSETQHIAFDKTAEPDFRRQNLVYRNSFKLAPGTYQLKFAVVDEYGNMGFAAQSVVVPPEDGRIAASSLFLAHQVTKLPELVQGLGPALLQESDALTFNGFQISSSPDNAFVTGAPVPLFFKLRNLPPDPETAHLEARVQLLGREGVFPSETRVPLQAFIFPTAVGEAVVGMNLPFENPAPGRYRLVVSIIAAGQEEPASLETDLEIR